MQQGTSQIIPTTGGMALRTEDGNVVLWGRGGRNGRACPSMLGGELSWLMSLDPSVTPMSAFLCRGESGVRHHQVRVGGTQTLGPAACCQEWAGGGGAECRGARGQGVPRKAQMLLWSTLWGLLCGCKAFCIGSGPHWDRGWAGRRGQQSWVGGLWIPSMRAQ